MARFIKRIFSFLYIGFIFHEKHKNLNILAICLTNFREDATSVLSTIDMPTNYVGITSGRRGLVY